MHLLEVPTRMLVTCLTIGRLLVIHRQVPLPVFLEPVCLNELILRLCGNLVFAPGVAPVPDYLSFLNELRCVIVSFLIELKGHPSVSLPTFRLRVECRSEDSIGSGGKELDAENPIVPFSSAETNAYVTSPPVSAHSRGIPRRAAVGTLGKWGPRNV